MGADDTGGIWYVIEAGIWGGGGAVGPATLPRSMAERPPGAAGAGLRVARGGGESSEAERMAAS